MFHYHWHASGGYWRELLYHPSIRLTVNPLKITRNEKQLSMCKQKKEEIESNGELNSRYMIQHSLCFPLFTNAFTHWILIGA